MKEPVRFGTDGWRGIIGENFTYRNVRRVGRALARLSQNRKIEDKPVVIGYDYRFMSEYFARAIYDELTGQHISAELSDRPVPTPALSFAAKKRKAAYGVMITASHNPHFYNGIKFKAGFGGPVMPDFTEEVASHLKKITKAPDDAPVYSESISGKNFMTPYLNAMKKYVDFDILKKSEMRIGVDSMYATGGTIIKDILSGTGISVYDIRSERNPLFNYDLPEPIPELLVPLKKIIQSENLEMGLATDGDADRIGVLDSSGKFVTLHYLMPLLYEYLAETRGWKGDAVRTTSTDPLFDEVCESLGKKCYEVPVGFKNVCEVVLEKDILVGGEESGGVCFMNHIPERDGILSALLILEMVTSRQTSLEELVKDMSRRFHGVEYLRIDRLYDQQKLKNNMKILRRNPPENIGGSKLSRADKKDGVKFYLENGCWMLMRVSNTEPKGRIYVGGPKLKDVKKTLNAGENLLFS